MGTSNVLWLDAASFAVSALLVAIAVPSPMGKRTPAGRHLDDVREGWRCLWTDRLFRAIALTAAVVDFLLASFFAVVLPVYANRVFGSARDLGPMLAGFGLGGLPGLAVAVAALSVAGLAGGGINPLAMTMLQERVPAELRGRVIGTVM